MTRSLSSVVTAAIAQDTTQPIYLIRMGWVTEQRVATWDTDISWNSETWSASGAQIDSLDNSKGVLRLPNGSADPWLNLVLTENQLDRTIQIYEHHTSTGSPSGSDATLIFTGVMDDAAIDERGIRIGLLEGRTNKGFPPTSIGPPTYNWLLKKGQRLFWNQDILAID